MRARIEKIGGELSLKRHSAIVITGFMRETTCETTKTGLSLSQILSRGGINDTRTGCRESVNTRCKESGRSLLEVHKSWMGRRTRQAVLIPRRQDVFYRGEKTRRKASSVAGEET